MDLDIKRLRNRVKVLLKKPQPEQRTPEWFKQRQTRITASEAASCLYKTRTVCEPYVKDFNITNFKYKDTEPLNPYETKEDYIIKKCNAFFGECVFKDNPYTLWGKRYEEIANRLYKKVYKTNVYEFGLISHGRLKWLAASPDGITEDGIMLEIKCPKSRKIDVTAPPLYYWIQVQIQLESVGLEHCDFLECEIEEIPSEQEFLQRHVCENQDIGILLLIKNSGPDPKYVYPPIELDHKEDYISWKDMFIQHRATETYVPIYFLITKYNVMRIARNRDWFAAVKDDIKETWELITKLQNNPEDFKKYKQSMDMLKNKAYWEKYHRTTCLINEHDSEFVFDTNGNDTNGNDTNGNDTNRNDTKMDILDEHTSNCLIDSSED